LRERKLATTGRSFQCRKRNDQWINLMTNIDSAYLYRMMTRQPTGRNDHPTEKHRFSEV
jgi:hypothetical protein